jgi:hypothetical protein
VTTHRGRVPIGHIDLGSAADAQRLSVAGHSTQVLAHFGKQVLAHFGNSVPEDRLTDQ